MCRHRTQNVRSTTELTSEIGEQSPTRTEYVLHQEAAATRLRVCLRVCVSVRPREKRSLWRTAAAAETATKQKGQHTNDSVRFYFLFVFRFFLSACLSLSVLFSGIDKWKTTQCFASAISYQLFYTHSVFGGEMHFRPQTNFSFVFLNDKRKWIRTQFVVFLFHKK